MSARSPDQIERLLDAVELIRENRRPEATSILRALIQEDSDFEEAWLWMSLAVESMDESAVCLDNVLRINPHNTQAAGALYRLRQPDLQAEQRRSRYRLQHDMALTALWLLVIATLFAVLMTYGRLMPVGP